MKSKLKKLDKDDLEKIAQTKCDFNIEDIETVITGVERNKDNPHEELTFSHPFKAVVVGKSNSGKTVLTINLLMKYLEYDTITIVSKTGHLQNQYSLFHDLSLIFPNKFKFKSSLASIKMKKFNKKLVNIVLIDDYQEGDKKEQQMFVELYTLGRHHGIHPIYLAQNFFKIPKNIRENVTQYVFFRTNSYREISTIRASVAGELEKTEFFELFRESTEPKTEDEDFPYLVIDTTKKSLGERYRKNFKELYERPSQYCHQMV